MDLCQWSQVPLKRKRRHIEIDDDEEICKNKRVRGKTSQILSRSSPILWSEWLAATSTRNYMLKDPVLDWIKYHMFDFVQRNNEYSDHVRRMINSRRDNDNFISFIMKQGQEFEREVIKLLYRGARHPITSEMIIDIGGDINPRSVSKVNDTINAMNRGIPIIYSGVLHNHKTKTYGIPDLMVRSDWVKHLVDEFPVNKKEETTSAIKLKDVHEPSKSPNYHYVIIDIKFATLNLRSDGIHILNSGSFPAYKSQVYIYNEALSEVQGYKPTKAYLLGRRWKCVRKNKKYEGPACFSKLGTVNFESVDKMYINETKKALEWLRRMKKEGGLWNPFLNPNPIKELYPNMCNTHDFPYHSIKLSIASETKELTSLWNVGKKNREIANLNNVYRWTDKRCSVNTLGIKGPYIGRILTQIIDINHSTQYKILPKIIKNNDLGWQRKQTLEFYVDFEAVTDVITDFSKMPEVECKSLLFMIGVGYIDPDRDVWVYKDFTSDDLTLDEEYRICVEFVNFIAAEMMWYKHYTPLLVHWAHFERTVWRKTIDRFENEGYNINRFNGVFATLLRDEAYIDSFEKRSKRRGVKPALKSIVDGSIIENDNTAEASISSATEVSSTGASIIGAAGATWFDLQKVFKTEPIVIKNCPSGFNLKEITKAINNYGFIPTSYDIDNDCSDGASAMLSALKAQHDAQNKGIGMRNVPIMKNIIQYNEVDCRVLYDIITYLRANHVNID